MVYVTNKNRLHLVSLARNHMFLNDPFSCYTLNVSQQMPAPRYELDITRFGRLNLLQIYRGVYALLAASHPIKAFFLVDPQRYLLIFPDLAITL